MVYNWRDCKGLISIDGRPETLPFNESADGNIDVVFALYPHAILNKLRDSEKVIVELTFY